MGFKQWAPSLRAWETVEVSAVFVFKLPFFSALTYSNLPCLQSYPMVLRAPSSSAYPPLTLSPPSPSEIPHLATLFRKAFEPTAIYQAMFGTCPPASYDAWNRARFAQWLANESAAASEGKKQRHWTVVARRGEQIVGFGHWELHAGKGGVEEEEESVPLPEGADKEKGPRIFDALHKASEGIEGKFISECCSLHPTRLVLHSMRFGADPRSRSASSTGHRPLPTAHRRRASYHTVLY